MSGFGEVIAPLAVTLALSLTVERILELAQNLLERLLRYAQSRAVPDSSVSAQAIAELEADQKRESEDRWHEEQAEALTARLEDLRERVQAAEDPQRQKELEAELAGLRAELAGKEAETAWDERVSGATLLVKPATEADPGQSLKPFALQLLGLAAGIVLARQADLQLFGTLLDFVGRAGALADWQDYLLTGLLIGGGSGPIHVLIRFITQRRVPATGPAGAEAEAPPEPAEAKTAEKAPHTPAAIRTAGAGDWIDVPYHGGVDREKLEDVHRWAADPDRIIYHHTAMDSRGTFEDVVRVIKSREDSRGNPWLTGYNCVITHQGSIHPFCRWDRYGNHAAGYNRRSLGIAFNGNFETDPAVPFANPDGRYGAFRPSEAQLTAGARVIALWTFLYGIAPEMGSTIVPHQAVSSTACPGSMFPHDELRRWVELYRGRWEKSQLAQERIEAFKLKPYVFVEGVSS